MTRISDRIFNEVCLDERITDGIFKMDNATHMDALRDYFVKRGITKEAAVHVTNRMVEGKYPERQAYNRDGILVTFPTPQHKSKAIARGTHFEKNPIPQAQQPQVEEPEPKQAPPGSNPEPGERPNDDADKEEDTNDEEDDDIGGGSGGGHGGGGGSGGGEGSVFQGDKQLEVEPPRGQDAPEPPPAPAQPEVPPLPRTPERVAAEKEIVKQILSTDDTTLSNIGGPIKVNELTESELNEYLKRHQLRELYKRADEWGFREAIKFLTPYVKP
jgi:hypothetical protein